MATSGSFNTSGYQGRYLTFSWSEKSQSIANNTTTISWTLKGAGAAESTYYYTRNIKLVIDGETVYTFGGSSSSYISLHNGTVVASGTYTIKHNNDGTRDFTVYAEAGIYVWAVNCTGTETFSLDDIPRATTLDSLSCATSYFTGKLTYKYTPKSSACYNRCNISLNLDGTYIAVKSINIGKKSASQQTGTVTLSADELAIIYKKLPSATKGVLRFTFRTYSDSDYSNQIGDAGYKELTLSIPNDTTTQPDVSMTLSPVGSLGDAFEGLYVQGKTKVKASLSADGQHEASIESYSMKVDGTTYDSGDSYTSGYLSKYGSIRVYGYAKDSRGFTGSTYKDIAVIAYSKPKITVSVCGRCDAEGNLSDDGTYLKIKATRSYSPVTSGGAQKNFCQIRYRYKAASASTYSAWTTILASSDVSSNTVETDALLGGVLAIDTSYLVQVQAIDDIGETADTVISVPTDAIHNHKAKSGWGMGKYCEGENLLDVGWDAHFHGEVLIGADGKTLKEYILAVISEGG